MRAPVLMRGATLAFLALLAVAAAIGCSGGDESESGPSPTQSPSPTPTPDAAGRGAVYLSLGDDVQGVCCQGFAAYLAQGTGTPVGWANFSGDTGAAELGGAGLDAAIAALRGYAASGQAAVAITLRAGMKDARAWQDACAADAACTDATFEADVLAPYAEAMSAAYTRLREAGAASAVFLQLDYFDAAQCGGQPDPYVTALNERIAQVAADNGGALVAASSALSCGDFAADGSLTTDGLAALEAAVIAAYAQVAGTPAPAAGD